MQAESGSMGDRAGDTEVYCRQGRWKPRTTMFRISKNGDRVGQERPRMLQAACLLQLPTKGSPSFYLSFVAWAVSSHTSFCLFLQITSTCFLDILYVSRQKGSLSVAEEKYTASNLLLQKITSLPAAPPRQRSSAEPRKARQAAEMADLASTGT